MALPLNASLSPDALVLKPGGSADVKVAVTNVSDIVQHYRAQVVGLPAAGMWSAEPALTKLRPGESGSISVRVSLPAKGGIGGGDHVLAVLVDSPYQADVSRACELRLRVATVAGVTMSVHPQVLQGNAGGTFAVQVRNEGNTPVDLTLACADDQGRARFSVTPPELSLAPDMTGSAHVRVSARGPVTGKERRSTIGVSALADARPVAQESVSLIQPPRIPTTVFTTLGVVLGVLMIAGSILVGSVLGRENRATPQPTVPAVATTAGGAQPSTSASGAEPPTLSTPLTLDPKKPVVGKPVTLAAASADAQTWTWEVLAPNGNIIGSATTPATFTFTFPSAGIFTVHLAVANPGGTLDQRLQVTVVDEQNSAALVVAKDLPVPVGMSVQDAAECPSGMVAVGGGVSTRDRTPAEAGTAVHLSMPAGDGDVPSRWRVGVRNEGETDATVVVQVVCASAPEGFTIASQDVTVSPASGGTAEAACPAGTVVLGGGGGITNSSDPALTFLEESLPVQDGDTSWNRWRVRADNNDSTNRTLTAYVLCALEPNGYEVSTDPATQPTLELGGELDQRVVTCPVGTHILSGGMGLDATVPRDDATFLVLRESAPSFGEEGQQGWTTAARMSSNLTQGVTRTAVCAAL